MNDLPAFTASAYANNTMRADLMTVSDNTVGHIGGSGYAQWPAEQSRRLAAYTAAQQIGGNYKQENQTVAAPKASLRVVRVFLVDPDERVPIDKRVLYRSDEMTTDATDQELFFGIPVNDLLKDHNAMRASVEWEEKTSEGTKSKTGLKDVRIRDLIMSVTTIASFESRIAA
jgi:hypothetical protein